MAKYRLDAPAALERIKVTLRKTTQISSIAKIQEDRPITIKDDKGNTSKLIAEIVALFITAMDKLKLDIRSMDDLHAELKVNSNKNLTDLLETEPELVTL